MEDMERYGDYNEYEEDIPKRRGGVLLLLKLTAILICLATVGIIGYRLYLFEYYPAKIKSFLFTENLTAHYRETGEPLTVKTQSLRFPYDDNEEGNFFCDHLYVIPAAGELQISARYNEAALRDIAAHYGMDTLEAAIDTFTFRLTDNEGRDYGAPSHIECDAFAMYHYYKLAFDGIAFDAPSDGGEAPKWIRLEIFVKGADDEKPFSYVPIYENNEDYASFTDYKIDQKEYPTL